MKRYLACMLSLVLLVACLAPCALAEEPAQTDTPDCFKGTIPREDGVCPFDYLSKAFRKFFGTPDEANELYLIDAFRRFRANPDEETKTDMIRIFKKYIYEGENNYYFMLNVFVAFLETADTEAEAFLTRTFDLFLAPGAKAETNDALAWPPAEGELPCAYGTDKDGKCLDAPEQDGGWLLGEKDGGWLLETSLVELLAANNPNQDELLLDMYGKLLDEASQHDNEKLGEWVAAFNKYFTAIEGDGRCGSCWSSDQGTPEEYKIFLLDSFRKVIDTEAPESDQFLAGLFADIVGGDEDLYSWDQWEELDPAPDEEKMYVLLNDFCTFLGNE